MFVVLPSQYVGKRGVGKERGGRAKEGDLHISQEIEAYNNINFITF